MIIRPSLRLWIACINTRVRIPKYASFRRIANSRLTSMGSRIEIARAFARARWGRRRVEGTEGGPIEPAREFEAHFAERNALGLTLDQARLEAERELTGHAGNYEGYSFGVSTGTLGCP